MLKEISAYGSLQRKIRNEAKLSIRALSELSGVSHSYLSQVENGTRPTPSPDVIKKISDALKYDYFAMMREAGYMNHVKQFGDYIKSERLKNSNSLETISKEVGLSPQDLEEIEDNKLIPSAGIIRKLSDLLSLNYGELMKLAGLWDNENNFIDPFEKIDNESEWSINFKVPRMESIYDDSLMTTRLIPPEEAKQRFLYLENLLTMDENIYLNKRVLTQDEKKRALEILKLVFENDHKQKE